MKHALDSANLFTTLFNEIKKTYFTFAKAGIALSLKEAAFNTLLHSKREQASEASRTERT